MRRNYSFLKTEDLDSGEFKRITDNALGVFREQERTPALYPVPMLFQAVAVVERFFINSARAGKESPPRTLTDEEFYTDEFFEKLEFATRQFQDALHGCALLMDAVHGITNTYAAIGACFLNPLCNPPERSMPMTREAARQSVGEHALMLALTYSSVPWTDEMYKRLTDWHAPALLLCPSTNIPPMAPLEVRLALDWAMGMDNNPERRFLTMADHFSEMLNPSGKALPQLDLPDDFLL